MCDFSKVTQQECLEARRRDMCFSAIKKSYCYWSYLRTAKKKKSTIKITQKSIFVSKKKKIFEIDTEQQSQIWSY